MQRPKSYNHQYVTVGIFASGYQILIISVSQTGIKLVWWYNFFFPLQLQELYTLLNENYVEDDDNMFRFDYSPDFLKW